MRAGTWQTRRVASKLTGSYLTAVSVAHLLHNILRLSSCFWKPDFLTTLLVCIAVRVNETDTFADEDGANDEYFDFEDISGALLGSRCGTIVCEPLAVH